MNIVLLIFSILLPICMGHYTPIIEGDELIRVADQPINETDRVITCKFLLDLLENNKYVCFSRDEIFNSSYGKPKNVVYDSVMKMMDINNILDKHNKEYFDKMIENSDLFSLTIKDPITIVLTNTFQFYFDKVEQILSNTTTYNNYTYTGIIHTGKKDINYLTFPNSSYVKNNNYCHYIDNKKNNVCISTEKNLYFEILDGFINHYFQRWIY
jgi:hypothetical protein